MRSVLFFLCLTLTASAQNLFLLDWAEGDLNGDGVPERVLLVSPQSPDPSNPRSKKQLVMMEYHNQTYRQVFQKSIEAPFFCKTPLLRLNSAYADFWGLQYVPPTRASPPASKSPSRPARGNSSP